MKPLYEEIPVFGITPLEQTVHVYVCLCVIQSWSNAEVGKQTKDH